VLFLKKITQISSFEYELQTTQFGRSKQAHLIVIALATGRLFLVTFCLATINVVTLVRFKIYLKKKNNLKASCKRIFFRILVNSISLIETFIVFYKVNGGSGCSLVQTNNLKAKRNLTFMVIFISFVFTIGTLPWSLYQVDSNLLDEKWPYLLDNLLTNIGTFFLLFSISFKIFVFYTFNRFYRNIFNAYFCKFYDFLKTSIFSHS
jgi:hypothetical protein